MTLDTRHGHAVTDARLGLVGRCLLVTVLGGLGVGGITAELFSVTASEDYLGAGLALGGIVGGVAGLLLGGLVAPFALRRATVTSGQPRRADFAAFAAAAAVTALVVWNAVVASAGGAMAGGAAWGFVAAGLAAAVALGALPWVMQPLR